MLSIVVEKLYRDYTPMAHICQWCIITQYPVIVNFIHFALIVHFGFPQVGYFAEPFYPQAKQSQLFLH